MPRTLTYVELPQNAKSWKNGLLFATPDARFFRRVDNRYTEMEKHLKERKTGPCWQVLYVDEKKRWNQVLAHVVMAEVFVEKPEGAKSVSVKDGDYLNLSIDNIVWPVSREYIREKKREGKKQGRIKALPIEYKKVPGKNAYITVEGKVARKELDGDYSLVKVVIQHNKTTDVKVVRLYDFETKKGVTVGVHTLLAETFLADQKGEKDSKVGFIDGNGLNISLDNLYWTTKVNPVDPRKDVKERLTETLPVECKYVDGVFVSPDGRVFTMRGNEYLELKHTDNGKSIKVYIPEGNGRTTKKNNYRPKKVAILMAMAYLPPKKDDEAEEPTFIDGDYRNVAATNLIRRKLAYPPKGAVEKPFTLPEEDVYSCNFHNLYVSKNAKVYVKSETGYRKVNVNRVIKPSGSESYLVSYFDLERKRYEMIVLKKLMAYAFLKCDKSDDIINVDQSYNTQAIENLYAKPHRARMVFLDQPAIVTYNTIADEYANYNEIYMNEEANVYYKRGDVYTKLVRFVISEKEKKQFIGCRYIDDDLNVKYYDIAEIYEGLFGQKLCFNQKRKELISKSKKKRVERQPKDGVRKPRDKKDQQIFVETLGEEFENSRCNMTLWLNREGMVYEYIPEKGYRKLSVRVEEKHGHKIAIVHYGINEKGRYKHKGLDRLLAETFIWKEEGKCPHNRKRILNCNTNERVERTQRILM